MFVVANVETINPFSLIDKADRRFRSCFFGEFDTIDAEALHGKHFNNFEMASGCQISLSELRK